MTAPPKNGSAAPPDAATRHEGMNEGHGFASPPCLACELGPQPFDPPPSLATPELIELLNRLIEAERAGAKTLAAFRKSADFAGVAADLAAVGRDEARYVAMLSGAVRRLGGEPSTVTGDFFTKAVAIEAADARLQFLNRGQRWVVRKLTEILPRIQGAALRDALAEMHRTHIDNIQRCDALIERLASTS